MNARRRGLRRRSSLLEALESCRRVSPEATLKDLLVFLYVCENEGLNMRELGWLTGMSDPMVSRTSRGLAAPGSPGWLAPGHGWLEVRVNPHDRRGRTLHLTPRGVSIRDRLEALIGEARPILVPAVPPTPQGTSAGSVRISNPG